MRWTLILLALLGLALAGCELTVRDDKHADGPGNSENAPGHNKH